MSQKTSANVFDFLNKTNELLSEMPLYKKMKSHNDELKEKVKALRYTIEYLELINANLTKKNKKLKMKLGKKQRDNEVTVDFGLDDKDVVDLGLNNEVETIETQNEDPNIKMEIIELEKVIHYMEEEVVEDAQEEEVIENTEEEEEEKVIEDAQEEEEVIEDAQEEEEEVIEDAQEEEEEVIENTEEEEVVEEAQEEEEEDAEEADVYEVTIKGKTYYVSNEVDSVIYAADENGDISIEAGIYKNGKPVFNKTK